MNDSFQDDEQPFLPRSSSEGRLIFSDGDAPSSSVVSNEINGMTEQNTNSKWNLQQYIYNSITAPFSHCLPQQPQTRLANENKLSARAKKSPYDHFNGTFSFVMTVIGAPSVGKSAICQQLKSQCQDIHSRRLFKFIAVQPDFQVGLEFDNQVYDLGIYDSLGFDDVELLKYLLEGQTQNPSKTEGKEPQTPRSKQRKRKIDSEGFLVIFDVGNTHSFEVACQFVEEIFNYFGYDPKSPLPEIQRPVSVFLVGNKIDCPREVSVANVRAFLERQLGNVQYFETSASANQGVKDLFSEMVKKVKEQRESYVKNNLLRRPSFWD